MSSVGSFGSFTTARLGIYAAQKGLSVTGNNIANINTVGYTRQRLDQISFKTGGADRYHSQTDVRVGNGTLPKSVSQLRDPYLDIRFRTENASVGFYNTQLKGLNGIATVLDEIGKNSEKQDGLLFAQFSDFFSSLEKLNTDAGTEVNDTLTRASANILVNLFHSAATKLETQRLNMETQLRQQVDDINSILTSIRDLNSSIRKSEIHGDPALELRDERNLLIDQLSEYVKIDATYSEEDIGAGKTVEKLTIRLGNANPDSDQKTDTAILVDGIYGAQLATPKANPDYVPVYDRTNQAYQAARDLLAAKDPDDDTVFVEDGLGNQFTSLDDFEAAVGNASFTQTARYVDENGEPTDDPLDAFQEFDSNYNLTVTQLKDVNGRLWSDISAPVSVKVRDTTGFPTKTKYSAELNLNGVWKDGDVIRVGDTELTVGQDGLAADDINSNPKLLAAAIRKALEGQDEFKDFDISTTTTRTADGATILLNLTAKEAGATPVPAPVISADTADFTPGGLTLGTPAASDPATTPATYTSTLTLDGTWNEGDVITIGAEPNQTTLEIGKDIGVRSASDPNLLAEALARRITVDDYTVTARNGSLVFTANNADITTPPALPALTVAPPEKAGLNQANEVSQPGQDADPSVDLNPDPESRDNGDGTISIFRVGYYQMGDDWYKYTSITHTNVDYPLVLDDNDLHGALQASRELLTEEGEFASAADIAVDESAAIKRGIPYYQHCLDLLARTFAQTFNEANSGYAVDQNGSYLDTNGGVIELAGAPISKSDGLTDDQRQALIDDGCVVMQADGATPALDENGDQIPDLERFLDAKGADKLGGNLFSIRGDSDDSEGITASNISVSQAWSTGDVHIVTTFTKLFGGEVSNTTQNENVRHMLTLMDAKHVYNPQNLDEYDAVSEHLFEGSFQEMLIKMSSVLGNDQRSASSSLDTHDNQALEIDTSRDAVSAVDLNDEAMNLMQYTHALNAAYRLMTTIDEALERLITGTGVTR